MQFSSISVQAEMPKFLPDEDETKAGLAYVVRLTWAKGDELQVFNMSNGMASCGTLTADNTAEITTFSGALDTSVGQGDELLLLYIKDADQSMDGGNISLDFSEQNGSGSGKVPFAVYATMTAGDLAIAGKTLSFTSLVSFLQISMANLPETAHIDTVAIFGMPTIVNLSFDGTLKTQPVIDGSISLIPNFNVSGTGTKTVYMTCPQAVYDETVGRSLSVMCDGVGYESAFPTAEFKTTLNYRMVLADFVCQDMTIFSAQVDKKPQIEGVYETGWTGEESFTVIDISTREVLDCELELCPTADGSEAWFQCTDMTDFQTGDYLIISPAVEFEDDSFLIDFSSQDGTLANAPMYMVATMHIEGEIVETVQFEYISAINKVEITDLAGIKAVAEQDSVVFVPSNYSVTGAEFGGVPYAVELSFDDNGSVVYTPLISYRNSDGSVDNPIAIAFDEPVTTGDNDDMSFWFSCPAADNLCNVEDEDSAWKSSSAKCPALWVIGDIDGFDRAFKFLIFDSLSAETYNTIVVTSMYPEDEFVDGDPIDGIG